MSIKTNIDTTYQKEATGMKSNILKNESKNVNEIEKNNNLK